MKLSRALQDIGTMKALLTVAENEARAAGDDLPGAEHLLLSAFSLPETSARVAFERAGGDPDRYRAAIGASHRDALRTVGVTAPGDFALGSVPAKTAAATGPLRTNASAQQVFQSAVALAKAARSPLLGAHVVLAVSQLEQGTVVRTLRGLGIDRDELGSAARAVLADTG